MSADTPGKGADTFRNFLAFFLISAFVAFLPLLVFKTIPGENKEIIVYMLGQLSGMAATAIGFYYISKAGQDAADAKRADNTGEAFKAITATANASGGPSPEPDVILEPGETAQAKGEGA